MIPCIVILNLHRLFSATYGNTLVFGTRDHVSHTGLADGGGNEAFGHSVAGLGATYALRTVHDHDPLSLGIIHLFRGDCQWQGKVRAQVPHTPLHPLHP